MAKTCPTYDVTHKKSKTKNQKKDFFIGDLKTCCIFLVFEQLSSTINWWATELLSMSISYAGAKHVNMCGSYNLKNKVGVVLR